MGDPNQNNMQVDLQKLENDTWNAIILSERMSDMKYSNLNGIVITKLKEKTKTYLKSYIEYFLLLKQNIPNKGEFEVKLSEYEIYMNDILHEWKKILFIEKRQRVVEKIQILKQRLYAVTTSDICSDFLTTLSEDSDKLVRELVKDNANVRFPDLFQDLERLIKNISTATQNTKKQKVLDATTGVLSLGASAVGGALGLVAVARKSARLAAKGLEISSAAASNVVFAGKCVATAANIAIEVVNVGGAFSNSSGCNENTSYITQPPYENEGCERLYSITQNTIEKESKSNVNDLVLLIFNEMTKD